MNRSSNKTTDQSGKSLGQEMIEKYGEDHHVRDRDERADSYVRPRRP